MSRSIRVTFFQVKNDKEKREKIIHIANEYFEKKEPLLIRLPHQKALEYVDLLLWKAPKDSFLPHSIKDEPCADFIVLTMSKNNPNQARSIFNLCPEPIIKKDSPFIKIYELEDLASTQKNSAAHQCYKAYKEQGYFITAL